jgi:hypothetical protein
MMAKRGATMMSWEASPSQTTSQPKKDQSMTKRNKGDMPRPKVNIMRHFSPPKDPPESKRKKPEKVLTYVESLEDFFQDIHAQISMWREISTGEGKHRRCHLPACKRHHQCLSRNDPYLMERFCHLKQRRKPKPKWMPGSVRDVYGDRI